MIKISTSDGVVWNKDDVIIDIALAMSNKDARIDISTMGEGPCAESLGLYLLLDRLCKRFHYPKDHIYLHTCNLKEHHDIYKVETSFQKKYFFSARKYAGKLDPQKNFGTNFKIFGHFIGHGNQFRLYLSSYLFDKYKSLTYQTYHCNLNDCYHDPFLAVEDLMRSNCSWSEIDRAIKLIKQCPITIDEIYQYPILDPETLNISKIYPNFFVEIVNLTYFSGNTFYVDEKIWRPIIMKTPFLIQGPQNFIGNLRKLGFRTFDQWWDEGYSEDPGKSQIDGIIANIDLLAQKTNMELQKIYQEMQSVLEHNYQLLMTGNSTDFEKACLS